MAFPDLLAAADRAALTHLGGPVRYAPTALAGESFADVLGIFDAAYIRVDAGQAGVSSCGPAVFLRLADLVAGDGTQFDPETDEVPTVTVNGISYRAREVQKDGMGGVLLLLHRA